jgi:hypothetical protein
MTPEDLAQIELALSPLDIHDGYSAAARSAALQFNTQVERERARFEEVRAAAGPAGAIPPSVEVELRATAAMYLVERARLVRVWRIPLRVPTGRRGTGTGG